MKNEAPTPDQLKQNPTLTKHHRYCELCTIFLLRTSIKRHNAIFHRVALQTVRLPVIKSEYI